MVVVGTDFETERDSAIFFTSNKRGIVNEFRSSGGGLLITDTNSGYELNKALPFDRLASLGITIDEYRDYWDVASREFANQASGDVKVFLGELDRKSTFYRVEMPALLNNVNVTSFNGVARSELLDLYNKTRENALFDSEKSIRAKDAVWKKIAEMEPEKSTSITVKIRIKHFDKKDQLVMDKDSKTQLQKSENLSRGLRHSN